MPIRSLNIEFECVRHSRRDVLSACKRLQPARERKRAIFPTVDLGSGSFGEPSVIRASYILRRTRR